MYFCKSNGQWPVPVYTDELKHSTLNIHPPCTSSSSAQHTPTAAASPLSTNASPSSSRPKLQYPSFLFPGKTQFTDAPAPKGLSIRRRINSCNPLNWLRVGNEIRKKQPDLVVFAYWMSFMAPCFGTIARRISRNHKTRCIGLIHNMIPHEPNLLDKLFPSYFVNAMHGFTTLSQAVIADINHFDHCNKPKTWAPHPIYDHYGQLIDKNEARRQLGLAENGKYVLFFGFIRDYKGLDLLIDAFGDLQLQDMGVKLIVAGEFYGSPKPYLDRIRALNINDIIVLHNDYIPDNRVNLYLISWHSPTKLPPKAA